MNTHQVFTPHSFGIYDVKVPLLSRRRRQALITTYAQPLSEGSYNIQDETDAMVSHYYDIKTPSGFYTPRSFVHSLQQALVNHHSTCSIKLVNKEMDDNRQGFLHITTDDHSYMEFDQRCTDIFQLERPFLGPNTVYTSKQPSDLTPDTHTLLIYCNLAGESIVGGGREKVLSIAPITHDKYHYGKWVTRVFASTDYYPLTMKSIQLIEIQLRGDTGNFLPISQGRSYVKLHFRRKTQP